MKIALPTTRRTLLAITLSACGPAYSDSLPSKAPAWDNDPNGVQVFILAGQSNMVGHAKAEDGHGDVKGAIGSLCYQVVGTEFPEWKGKGYRIAGFGWHQGWNDRCDKTASENYEAISATTGITTGKASS